MNFWLDNWLGDGPLIDSVPVIGSVNLQVEEVVDETGPNFCRLSELVNEEILTKISDEGVWLRQGSDICVWKSSVDGGFSTKSAWHIIRHWGEICTWKKWLWKDWLPKKMYFFVWRAKRIADPVDDVILNLEIPLVSKCECCDQPKVETFHHLLCEGDGAKMVWRFFVDPELEGDDVELVA